MNKNILSADRIFLKDYAYLKVCFYFSGISENLKEDIFNMQTCEKMLIFHHFIVWIIQIGI